MGISALSRVGVSLNKWALFWVKLWYSVGWKQRAQWIILQNMKKEFRSVQRMSLCSCKETPIFDEERLNKCLKCGLPLHR